MRTAILAIGALAASVAATPVRSSYAVKERHAVPREWTRIDDAPRRHTINLQIGIKQHRFDELEQQLYEVSDPEHARYGEHLSQAEVNELVRPAADSLALVKEWLSEHVDVGKAVYSPAKDFITITMPVAVAEKMLKTKYSTFQHDDGSRLVRTPEWSLPKHLHEHITAVQPTTAFIRTVPQAKTYVNVPGVVPHMQSYRTPNNPTVDSVCDTAAVTPDCLRTLYGTINYKPQVPGKNVVGLTDYLGEVNNRSDAEIYLQHYRPDAVSAAYTFSQISVNGGPLDQGQLSSADLKAGVGIEGNLDAQTILGIDYPTPLVVWSTAGNPPFKPDADNPTVDNEPYLTWVNYVLSQPFIPQVISNSYEDNEQTVPESYAKVVCSQFAQLGARGVSVFFGSGDGGVAGVQPGGSCKSNVDGKKAFLPLFPSSCPYVTSVGATVNFNPEVVAFDPRNNFSSGGGFSNYFSQPSYQASAVHGYLREIGNDFAGLYNKSGRAYPDIAAYGVNYTVIWNGTRRLVDGTSASTPTAAALFSLVNDALLAAGKKPLGFLNPWLYKTGYKAFTDVTKGSTLGCNTTGFEAKAGWDAASGFGTPQFGKLLQLLGLGGGYGGGGYGGGGYHPGGGYS